jgi:nicotinamidase-related amidase
MQLLHRFAAVTVWPAGQQRSAAMEKKRSAIIVIDLLKGFFKKNPTLPDPIDSTKLFGTVRGVIDAGRKQGVNIVFIKDNFIPEEVPIDKHFKIYGPHCVIGTPDAEVVDELAPQPGDFQIRKKHYSSFNSTRLDAVLRELDVRKLYISGAWTEACVQHTVVDAFYHNYEICVLRDAVSSPHREAHEYALNYMRQYHRAKIITSEQAIAQFASDEVAVHSNALIPPEGENLSYREWTLASRS